MPDQTRVGQPLHAADPAHSGGHDAPTPGAPAKGRWTGPDGQRLAQAARADYSIKWTETGLQGPLPPEATGDWPSDRWRAHLATCPDGRKCRCQVPEPEWWVLMAGRGMPLHPDAEVARQMAHQKITRFKGQPALPAAERAFVQEVVRDALFIAPQPLSKSWVGASLSVVTRLVRVLSEENAPLTREHAFSERSLSRFKHVHMANHADKHTANFYDGRLNLIAAALKGVTYRDKKNTSSRFDMVPNAPVSKQEEAALYLWATGLRSSTRRRRMTAMLATGLGVGMQTGEFMQARRRDVNITDTGVHVRITNIHNSAERTVTCRRAWEDVLRDLCDGLEPDALLMEPTRTNPLGEGSHNAMVSRAQNETEPPTWVNQRRLRLTWMVRLIEAGVPFDTIMKAADVVTTEALTRLMVYVTPQTDAEASASLRG